MAELESKIQRRCQEIITHNGGFVFKTHGNQYTRAGLPDLVACVPVDIQTLIRMVNNNYYKDNKVGVFMAFEVKREGHLNELSKAQEIVGKEIQKAGGQWDAVDNSNLIQDKLKKMRGEL